jgi:heme exporter protein D
VYKLYKQDKQGSKSIYMISVNFRAFPGSSLLYDPDFSVLLNNNEGDGGGACEDSQQYWDPKDVYLWLTLGMVVLAIASVVVAAFAMRVPWIRDKMIGPEARRIRSARYEARRESTMRGSSPRSECSLSTSSSREEEDEERGCG